MLLCHIWILALTGAEGRLFGHFSALKRKCGFLIIHQNKYSDFSEVLSGNSCLFKVIGSLNLLSVAVVITSCFSQRTSVVVGCIVLCHCRRAGGETGKFWGAVSCVLKDEVSATWASFPVCLCAEVLFSKKGLQAAACPLELPAEFLRDSEISRGNGQNVPEKWTMRLMWPAS